jgi:Icc-related predicted phosphoesterase
MKIIALPDLHQDGINRLASVADPLSAADLVLLVGDLTNGGSAADAARVIDAVRQYNASILAVPGNWDGLPVADYLTKEGINLHRRNVIIDRMAFVGVGASLPAVVETPNEATEADLNSFLAEAVAGLDPAVPKILVSHQPPARTLNDKTWTDLHVGSRAVREFIETLQPLICFTGHIHEAVGIDVIGNTRIVNPGPLSEGGYAYAVITPQGIETLEIRGRKS